MNSYNSVTKAPATQIKVSKNANTHFSTEDGRMASKRMRRSSVTVRYALHRHRTRTMTSVGKGAQKRESSDTAALENRPPVPR